ncbi:MAG: DUF4168 domain-containing protein [Bacteroidetes bacterium]|jgi:triphosphoribosyl-dephospho-CoA synthetase|nr:DUF4168 domain-containing protein [Bacteroidota bacterium]
MTLKKNSMIHAQSIFTMALMALFMLAAGNKVTAQPPMQQPQQMQVAQPSDEEIQLFVEAAKQVQPLQQEAQQKMVQKIQSYDLGVQEFNEIMQSKQNPNSDVEVSSEDEQAFQKASQEIKVVQQQYQQKIQQKVEETGLEMSKYREIMMAYRQDQELQSKVNQMMQQ